MATIFDLGRDEDERLRLRASGPPTPFTREGERRELDRLWEILNQNLETDHARNARVDPTLFRTASEALNAVAGQHVPQSRHPYEAISANPESHKAFKGFLGGLRGEEFDPASISPIVEALLGHSGIPQSEADRIRRGVQGEDPGSLADVLTKMAQKIGAPP